MKRFVKSFLTLSLFSLLSVWGVKADVIGSCVWTYGAGVLTISACPGSAPGILEPENAPSDTIGIERFYPYYKYKQQIRKIIIEPGVTKIGTYAFAGLPYLGKISFVGTSTLRIVGDYAFFDAPHFSSIELDDTYDKPYGLPASVQVVGDYAFSRTNLLSFSIPDSCVSIGEGAFSYSQVTNFSVNKSDNFKVSSDRKFILDATGTEIIAAITGITSLYIPDNITTIRSGAFYGCSTIESISGCKGLTLIESKAFGNVSGLKSIYMSGTKEVKIKTNAFDPVLKTTCVATASNEKTVANLENIVAQSFSSICGPKLYWHFSAGQDSILISGDGNMYDFEEKTPWSPFKNQIISISFSNKCTSIGRNAFSGMSMLSDIRGSLNSIVTIGNKAFYGSTALTNFNFDIFPNLTFIGDSALTGLKMRHLTIPSHIIHIGKDALLSSSLLSIEDKSSAEINTSQFSATQKKSCIVWAKTAAQREKYLAAGLSESNVFVSNCDNDICQLNWHFDDATGKLTITGTGEIYAYEENAFPWNAIKTKIKEVQLPASATLIPDYAFAGCISLSSIHHEGSSDIAHVKSIGSYAFKDASFSEFSLNSNITSIGINPFDGDMGLKKLSVATTAFNEQEKLAGLSKRDLCIHVTSDDPATADAIYQFFKGTAKFENVIYKNCGNTLSWDFNDGTLIIRNTSNNRVPCTMWNFGGADQQPWAAYRNSITAVRLPDELTSISSYAFAGCKNLKSITLPLMVNEIGSHAFENTGITQIEIPASVNSIDAWGTHSLKQVTVDPANKRYTSRDADGKELNMLFDMGYVDLHICPSTTTNISLPGSLTVIGTSAFNGSVGKLTIPASVKTMNSWPTSATAIYAANEPTIYEKEIPATLLATKVYATTAKVKTAYEKMGFTNVETISSCGKNASYLFDKGVLTIFGSGDVTSHPWSDMATYIKRVVIEKGITSLCSEAFKNCTALKTLTLPDGLETINASFIEGCTSLKSLCIPNTVKELAPYVFKGSSLTHIEAQNGGSFISTDANGKFCNALYTSDRKTLVLAIETAITNELTTIREYAMAGSTIKDLNIPSSVTTIGAYAFAEASITNIYSSSVAAIPSTAFSDKVKERANVYVSDLNVKTVFSKAGFAEEKIVIAKGKCGDNLYYSPKNKNLIIFGSGDMDDYSSNDAPWSDLGSTITSISFVGEAITKIGDNAFESFTAIRTLSLPASVTYIGQNAFAAAKGITTVEAGAGVPPTLSDGALTDEVYAKAKLIVPTASKATYSTAQNWENFGELLSKEEAKNPYDLNNDNKVNASDISLLKKNVR
ncbi:MAG: leucine-rich repeat protein [Paludibacteraceae bacterium]|nr:leucine-rich repeat protein [Paludibacteraceae bacterium]